ncbi:MAG: alpha/beta hydrolase [Bacteroidales bacterium]|nr:alpha/beta hydrolase [Bacteroidales bacterium]
MAETILMIHGMCAGPWCWDNYQKYFESEGYKCIKSTLRFHEMDPNNKPDPQLGTISLLDYIDDLVEEINQLEELPIIMGHSMGGLLTQKLAEKRLAKAAILLTPATPAGIFNFKFSQVKTFWSIQNTSGFWKKPIRFTFHEFKYGVLNLLPPDKQKEIYEKLVFDSGKALAEIAYWFFDSKNATKVDESKVTCPVLVIGGGRDRITPSSLTRKVAMKYKAVSTYKEFENNAHWIIGEDGWEEIAGFTNHWLKREMQK